MTLIQEHRKLDFEKINFVRLVGFHKESLEKMLSGETPTSLFSLTERRKLVKENIIVYQSRRYVHFSFVTDEAKEVLKNQSWLNPFSLDELPPEPLRVCKVCGLEAWSESDLEAFAKNKVSLHGVQPICRPCYNLRDRIRNAALWRN